MDIVDKLTNNEGNDTEPPIQPQFTSWDELQIDPNILRGIFAYGFEKPSPIQQKAIVPILQKKDVVAQAQSGTGKTATFSIGALQNVNTNKSETQVLILSPTRELCLQTSKVIQHIGAFMENLKVHVSFGGTSNDDFGSFSDKKIPHIICGCPGRIYDMLRRNKINGKQIQMIVLDEADELLSFSFKEQMYNIFQYLNEHAQVCLFSATLPQNVEPIIQKIMRNPVQIFVKKEQLTLEGIMQYYIPVDNDRQKYITLKNIFSFVNLSHTIIYCNSVKRVQELYEAMQEDGFPVCRIHSGMDKQSRSSSFKDFKTGQTRYLISSNVTSRGIDIQQVSLVINFDLPKCVHNYLHRIGRSGRWGRKGVGINFVASYDVQQLKKIEQHYSTEIIEMPADLNFLSNI
jgi:translation initiation factor 4A